MNRRDALTRLTVLTGGAMLLTAGLLPSCNISDKARTALTEKDIPLLDEIGETIIPSTATSPGAKAAGIGAFMVTMVNDCFTVKEKAVFIEGLNRLEAACRQQYKTAFTNLDPAGKKTFLQQLDAEANHLPANKKQEDPEHYFTMLKELTITGYFTSEIGTTRALRYEPIPGSYSGCINSKKGDKPWASY